jgi:hypothetical protein
MGQLFGPGGKPLSNIGSMGGECGPLGRRHSGKGRAVPVRRPSITVSQRKMPSTRPPWHQHPAILKLSRWSVPPSNSSRLI